MKSIQACCGFEEYRQEEVKLNVLNPPPLSGSCYSFKCVQNITNAYFFDGNPYLLIRWKGEKGGNALGTKEGKAKKKWLTKTPQIPNLNDPLLHLE